VFFVGAGLSCAFGVPNTPSLINEVLSFSYTKPGKWLRDESFKARLDQAFQFFYPDADHAGFQPDVVDFFSTLRTYLDVGAGLVGTGFNEAPELYRLLRRAIAQLLIYRTRDVDAETLRDNAYLNRMIQPGNIIITSNWDQMIERHANLRQLRLRLSSAGRHFNDDEVTLLKLHGSVDWTMNKSRVARYTDDNYAALSELQHGERSRRPALPSESNEVVRIRTKPTSAWNEVRSRSREPHLVTMATGKADDLGPLVEVWRDAYRALSRAQTIEIVGYSMPPDDVEIRTILRTGIQRGSQPPAVLTKNPAPDVHYRVRQLLQRTAKSDFTPVPP